VNNGQVVTVNERSQRGGCLLLKNNDSENNSLLLVRAGADAPAGSKLHSFMAQVYAGVGVYAVE